MGETDATPAATRTGRRARRVWRVGNSLVLSLDLRDVKRLHLEPGDFVWIEVTAVELVRRPVALEDSIERVLNLVGPALWVLPGAVLPGATQPRA